jgi:mono/diheme cytochrome c family protein
MLDSFYAMLARAGFNEPIHAPITHMPVGLAAGALLFILAAIVLGRRNLAATARHVSILAFIFVFPTILLGVMDWLHFYRGALIQPIRVKMALAAVMTLVLLAGIILGGGVKVRSGPMAVIYAVAFLAAAGLGMYGAKLVPGVYAAASPARTAQATEATPAAAGGGSAAAGQKVFADNCASCHPGGGNVVDPGLPLRTSKRIGSQASLTAFIRAPSRTDGKENQMPGFPPDAVSDPQAADLFAYVSSMAGRW